MPITLVNLHSHLEGRVRPATAARLAADAGLPPPAGGWQRALTLTGPADLTAYLDRVAASFPLFHSVDAVARIAREAVEDAAADGVRYLELRFGPATHVRPGLDVDRLVRAACEGLRDGARGTGTGAGLVVAALRMRDGESNEAVARAAARHAGDGVVGFDLAGDESRRPGVEPFAPAFAIARAAGLGLTCHAAEAAPAAAALEAVRVLGVSRIGHGTRVADDPRTMAELADRGVVVEVCPTSNWYTGAIADVAEHPAARFVRAGIPVVLGDDNPVQTGSPMSAEHALLTERLGFTAAEVDALDRTSRRAAFDAV